jgi:hypothetical protein
MKTTFLFVGLLYFSLANGSMTAGAANNDTLILYSAVILVLALLIGSPYFIRYIKRKIKI